MTKEQQMRARAALRYAISLAGSQDKFANLIGVKQTNINCWLNRNSRVTPAQFVLTIETKLNGLVSRHELRPDIYPRDL